MKLHSLRVVALAVVAATTFLTGTNPASAFNIGISVGTPPPPGPPPPEHRWARPYPGAVWIAPHREWRDGAWVIVHGYYAYPPHPGAVWVEGTYHHGSWMAGHWR